MSESRQFDVKDFLEKYKHPHIRVFCNRGSERLFQWYDVTGLPKVTQVCCLILEGWGRSTFMDGGAFPQPLAISGCNDNGWYAATLPVIQDRDYGPVQLGSILDGFAAKMLQLQREEAVRTGRRVPWPIIEIADRTWATFRKKIAAFIAA
jgi:hypothetical protein